MTEELEYVRLKQNDGHIYRVKGYTSDGDVLIVCVTGGIFYRTITVPIDELEPVERDPYDVLGSVSPAD